MKTHYFNENHYLNYIDEGDGPIILFGHSFLWDHQMWKSVIQQLSSNFRCIAPDLFGHGHSSPCPLLDLEKYALYMSKFIASLKIEKYSIAGLSIGGMWGAYLSQLDHSKIDKLILLNTSLTEEPIDTKLLYNSMLTSVEEAGHMPQAIIDAVSPGFFSEFSPSDSIKDFKAKLTDLNATQVQTVVDIGRSFVNRKKLLPYISHLSKKVCVLAGNEDAYRSVEEAKLIADSVDGKLHIINAGHISSVDNPALVSEIIKDFMMN